MVWELEDDEEEMQEVMVTRMVDNALSKACTSDQRCNEAVVTCSMSQFQEVKL